MSVHEGGCLCGAIRFAVAGEPLRVTVCYCGFCQRATGSAYLVEPVFEPSALRVTQGVPRTYGHVSEGSGKHVWIHFCPACSSKLYLSFERWPDRIGIYAGAFDDPGWFEVSPTTTRHIFTDEAPRGAVIPSGFRTFGQHAMTPDGAELEPTILDAPRYVERSRPRA